MIDRGFYKVAGVFAAYIVAVIPLYFIVGWANLYFGWHVSYDIACFFLLVVAITVVGNMDLGKKKSGANSS